MSRVRRSMSASIADVSSRPSFVSTKRTSTPRGSKFIHGYTFDGYSMSAVMTLSPSFQSNPFATRPMPWVVFGTQGPIALWDDLRRRGFEVREIDVSEFVKLGGGIKCLTLQHYVCE